jgi:hypothetical protein
MKVALSLTLVVALMTSALPVTAQERIDRTAGPISRAITRGAVRLAAEPAAVDDRQPAGEPTNVDRPRIDAQTPAQSADEVAWSRVQRLSTGEEVRVAGENGASSSGAFRTSDGASITLLVAGREQTTARADVRQVSVVRDTDRWQHVVIGIVIGGLTGGVAVALHCRGESSSCKEVSPAYVGPGVGLGAAVGALLPPRKQWQEIYVRSGA